MNRSDCEKGREKLITKTCNKKFCPLINQRCQPNCVNLKAPIVHEGSMAGDYKVIICCDHFDLEIK